MKAFELLKVNESLLKVMDGLSLAISDVKYIDLVSDFQEMASRGEKKTYIVQVLSDKYDVAERTIYRVVDKLLSDIAV